MKVAVGLTHLELRTFDDRLGFGSRNRGERGNECRHEKSFHVRAPHERESGRLGLERIECRCELDRRFELGDELVLNRFEFAQPAGKSKCFDAFEKRIDIGSKDLK